VLGGGEVALDTITFRHQDGDMTFNVKWAWFHVSTANWLSLSIQCAEHPEHQWMSTPCFCLVDLPLAQPLAEGTVVRFAGNADTDEEGPTARVYTGSHNLPRDIDIKVIQLTESSCDVEVTWVQGDPDYYDERAKGTTVVGRCRLKHGQKKNIWNPG
jgi:hypothetical protein